MDAYKDAQHEEFSNWLLKSIAEFYGCEPIQAAIDRQVYKNTECGAWIKFDNQGIKVGTIVEGCDAEYCERVDVGQYNELTTKELQERFLDALKNCENFANEHWELA